MLIIGKKKKRILQNLSRLLVIQNESIRPIDELTVLHLYSSIAYDIGGNKAIDQLKRYGEDARLERYGKNSSYKVGGEDDDKERDKELL